MTRLPRREMIFALITLTLVIGGALGTCLYWYLTKPSQFRVAVGVHGSNEQVLMDAFSSVLKEVKAGISVQPIFLDSHDAAADSLQQGRSPFAVVRPDVKLPNNGMTLAILREEALIIAAPAAPAQRKISDISELAGKRIALLDMRDPDQALLMRVLSNYDIAEKDMRFVPTQAAQIPALVQTRQIDAIAFLAAPISAEVGQIIRAYSRALGSDVNILPVDDAEVLSLRFPVYSQIKVPEGAFGGRPKKPSEEFNTIGVSYRLMASARADRQPVSELTAHLFRLRARIAATTATINTMKAPDTDSATSAALPVHPGAVDYLNREQLTFMDRWGDWLWLGLFAGGGLTSVLAWMSNLFAQQKRKAVDDILEELAMLLAYARKARSAEDLERVTARLDEVVRQSIRYTRNGLTNTRTMSALMLAIESTRSAIADRRHLLQSPHAH